MVETVLSIDTGYGNEGKAEEITLDVDFTPVYKCKDVEVYSISYRATSRDWEVMTSAGTWTVDTVRVYYISDDNHFSIRTLVCSEDTKEFIKKYCLRQNDPEVEE